MERTVRTKWSKLLTANLAVIFSSCRWCKNMFEIEKEKVGDPARCNFSAICDRRRSGDPDIVNHIAYLQGGSAHIVILSIYNQLFYSFYSNSFSTSHLLSSIANVV